MALALYFQVHNECRNNEEAVKNSWFCGCFYCINTFAPDEIVDWLDEGKSDKGVLMQRTALCPRCCIDSVLPKKDYYEITDELLEGMHEMCFT